MTNMTMLLIAPVALGLIVQAGSLATLTPAHVLNATVVVSDTFSTTSSIPAMSFETTPTLQDKQAARCSHWGEVCHNADDCCQSQRECGCCHCTSNIASPEGTCGACDLEPIPSKCWLPLPQDTMVAASADISAAQAFTDLAARAESSVTMPPRISASTVTGGKAHALTAREVASARPTTQHINQVRRWWRHDAKGIDQWLDNRPIGTTNDRTHDDVTCDKAVSGALSS